MTQKEKLIELIIESVRGCARNWAEVIADYLLTNGVIVPPCKVGDTVYAIATKQPCYSCKKCMDFCHKDCIFDDRNILVVKKATVRSIFITENAFELHIEFEEAKLTHSYYSCFYFDEFGEKVFLTHKEAEKALAGRSGK